MEKIVKIAAGDRIRLAFPVSIAPLKIAQSIERVNSAIEIALFTEILSQVARKGHWGQCYQIYIQADYSGLMAEYSYEIPADSVTAINREISKVVHTDLPKKIERDLLYSALNESEN